MRDRLEKALGHPTAVLVVTFAPVGALEKFRQHLALPFEVASDPERRAYRAYGLLSASRWAIWHPRVLLRYARLLVSGMKLEKAPEGEDLSQLGGDFVIDATGTVRLSYLSHRSDDRPSIETLRAALAPLS